MKQFLFICFFCLPIVVFAQKDGVTLADQYTQRADSLVDNADFQASQVLYEQAASLYKAAQRWKGYSHCQNKLAENLAREGEFDEAFKLVNETLSFIEEKIGKGNVQEANAYTTLGLIYLNIGRDDLALEQFQKSLVLYKSLTGEESRETAQAYAYLGLVYWDSDNDELALDYQRRALAIRKKLYGGKHPTVAASFNDIGLIYADQDQEKARKYFLDALLTYEEVYGEQHPKVANSYINLANIYRQEKKFNVALNNFDKALQIWEKEYGQEHHNVGFVYNNMGQVYADQESWKLALQFHEKALKNYQKNYGNKHPKVANTYNLLGSVKGSTGDYKGALQDYQYAIIANIPDFETTDYYGSPDLKEYYNPTLLLATLQQKARAFEGLHFGKTLRFKDLKAAMEQLDLCDILIAKIRQTRSSKKDKIALGIIAADIYEEAIRISVAMSEVTLNEQYYLKKAFEYAEKSKAAVLLSAISDTEAKQFANIPTELLENEKELKSEISSLEQKAADAADAEEEEEYRKKLFELNQRYTTFIKELESKFPDYYNLKYNVKTTSVADIQAVLDDETAMVNYFIADSDNRLYTFIITKKRFIVVNEAKDENFERFQIGMQNAIVHLVDPLYLETAASLYKQLFPRKLPASIKKLAIIPDGNLGAIPFESLLTEEVEENTPAHQWPYLIRKYAIYYHISATLFVQAQQKKASEAKGIFLIGPVEFVTEADKSRAFLAELPGTETEINALSDLFTGRNLPVQSYLHQQAQETKVKSEELKKYRYLHFATHGVVDQNHPELSRIFLASSNDQEDGSLYGGEIYNLEINADLVCLSACQTGLGKISKGEGIIGLSRALIYAGANNLIVSYWTVSDASTMELMKDFYAAFPKNKQTDRYARYMQEAKLKMIQSEKYAHPYYWAAFVLIGK